MNVFVLCTGRCGSVTFTEAARHITNFTAGHETRTHLTGPDRFAYAPNHIEADNRLSWLLGRLELAFGDDAFYVHLQRDRMATAQSFAKRFGRGIIEAYATSILMRSQRLSKDTTPLEFCLDYCDTITANIEVFLKSKSRTFSMRMETAQEQLPDLWDRIGAHGNLEAALAEWDVRHNESKQD